MTINIDTNGEFAEPQIGSPTEGGRQSVAKFVHACHDSSPNEAIEMLGFDQMDSAEIDEILVYCAQRRCVDDDATCKGCRMRTHAHGYGSFDDFVSAHKEITFPNSETRIDGSGTISLTATSLSDLITTWEGEEYWYWARRVLRKLRHGVRRAGKNTVPFEDEGETPAIVLVRPQLADNIGMCARAMANFGLDDMRIVQARDGWPNERARVAATGANYVIDTARPHDTVARATSDLTWVCATTARQRDLRKTIMTPQQAISEMSRRIAKGQKCGILFGPEASGMTTDDLSTADALVMIPVNNKFASLNLAQAVLIMGYSWILTLQTMNLGRTTEKERPVTEGLDLGSDRPATKDELNGFFQHLEGALDQSGFFKPPERRPTVVNNLRTLFTRTGLTDQEVRTMRGIVATLTRSSKSSHNRD